jgi:hypothetical protein
MVQEGSADREYLPPLDIVIFTSLLWEIAGDVSYITPDSPPSLPVAFLLKGLFVLLFSPALVSRSDCCPLN